MDYKKFIKSSSIDVKVSDNLIEYDKSTWQIQNIVSTVVGHIKIPFNEPEPKFLEKKPELDIDFIVLFILSGIGFIVGVWYFDVWSGLFLAICISCALIYHDFGKLHALTIEWTKKKEKFQRQWAIWDDIKRNPPVFHTLVLETNAGSKTLFYSLEEYQIIEVRDTISNSMKKQYNMGSIVINMNTFNFGGDDAINNFGSTVYQQAIKEK